MQPEHPKAVFSPKATSSSGLAFCFQVCQGCLLLCGFQWKDWLFWDASCTSWNKVVIKDPHCSFSRDLAEIWTPSWDRKLFSLLTFVGLPSLSALICPPPVCCCFNSVPSTQLSLRQRDRTGVLKIIVSTLSLSVLMCKTEKNLAYPIEWFQVKGIASSWLKSICYSFGVLLPLLVF